jgi:hypothetical protein
MPGLQLVEAIGRSHASGAIRSQFERDRAFPATGLGENALKFSLQPSEITLFNELRTFP